MEKISVTLPKGAQLKRLKDFKQGQLLFDSRGNISMRVGWGDIDDPGNGSEKHIGVVPFTGPSRWQVQWIETLGKEGPAAVSIPADSLRVDFDEWQWTASTPEALGELHVTEHGATVTVLNPALGSDAETILLDLHSGSLLDLTRGQTMCAKRWSLLARDGELDVMKLAAIPTDHPAD